MLSVKVAHRHRERKSRVEIVPNPLGGVNTHLWRSESYIVGIVPVVRPAYSKKKNGTGAGGEVACLLGLVFRGGTLSAIPIESFEP